MDTLEVFALNIQSSQLKKATSQYNPTQEDLEGTRKEFLVWLQERRKSMLKLAETAGFTDQVSAWEAFIKYIDYDLFDEEELELEPSWMEELEAALENQIRVGNYNEYGGQQ